MADEQSSVYLIFYPSKSKDLRKMKPSEWQELYVRILKIIESTLTPEQAYPFLEIIAKGIRIQVIKGEPTVKSSLV